MTTRRLRQEAQRKREPTKANLIYHLGNARDRYENLKAAVEALLRESPLLQGEPNEGTVTGRLVKKVLEAME